MVLNRKVNKGIILAAGDGDRLGSLTITCPKVLLAVNDKTLISYPIEVLAAAGISDVIRFLISQGHRFDTCNVSGCSWADVDTEEDLKMLRV